MEPKPPLVRSSTDLAEFWQFVDGGHGYSLPQLFALIIDGRGLVLPQIVHVYDEDVGWDGPPAQLPDLITLLRGVLAEHAPDGSVAVMRARPGSSLLTPADRRWCVALHEALRSAPFATHPLFFATDHSVDIVPPDALIPDA